MNIHTRTRTDTYAQAVRLDKVIGRGVTAENSEASRVYLVASAKSHDTDTHKMCMGYICTYTYS